MQETYCLVRALTNAAAREPVEESLKARKLGDTLSAMSVAQKIVCLASDPSDATLGLGRGLFREISREVDRGIPLRLG